MKNRMLSVLTALALCVSLVPPAMAAESAPEDQLPETSAQEQTPGTQTPENQPQVPGGQPQVPSDQPQVPEDQPQEPPKPEAPLDPAPVPPTAEKFEPVLLDEYTAGAGLVRSYQVGETLRLELEDATLREPIEVRGDLELVLLGDNLIQTYDSNARAAASGISVTGGSLTVSGEGSLTVRSASGGSKLGFGSEVPGVSVTGGVFTLDEESAPDLNAIVLTDDAQAPVQIVGKVKLQNIARFGGYVSDGVLRVNSGAVLTIPATAELDVPLEQIENLGTIVNDGFLTGSVLLDPIDAVQALELQGSGMVCTEQEGDEAYFDNDGMPVYFVSTPLDFTADGGYDPRAALDQDGYEFIPAESEGTPRLVLKNFHYAGPAVLPALTVPNGTVVELRGENDLYQQLLSDGPVTDAVGVVRVEGPEGAYPELKLEGKGILRARVTNSLAGDAIVTIAGRADVRVQSQYMSQRSVCMVKDKAQLTARSLWSVMFMLDGNARAAIDSTGHFGLFTMKGAMINGGTLDVSAQTLPIGASEKINASMDKGVEIVVPADGRQASMRVWSERLWSVLPGWEREMLVSDSTSGYVSSTVARHVVLTAGEAVEPGPVEPDPDPDPVDPDPGYFPDPAPQDDPNEKTVHNPDGSVTKVKENPVTGTKTETTTFPDGTVVRVEIKKDGTVTTTRDNADGSRRESLERPDGSSDLSETYKNGVRVVVHTDSTGVRAEVYLPAGMDSADVVIPLRHPSHSKVIVLLNPDGSQTIVHGCVPTDAGLRFTAQGSCKLKVSDRSRRFEDVPAGFWAENAIEFVVARGMYSGTGPTTFSPNVGMTRGMLATVLHNLEGKPAGFFQGSFTDVDSELWCADAIIWAAGRGVVKGYPDGTFRQNSVIQRQDLVVMLYNYAGRPAVESTALHFPDADKVASYAYEPLCWGIEHGILSGTAEGNLDPGGTATRAQVAVMMMHFLMDQQG